MINPLSLHHLAKHLASAAFLTCCAAAVAFEPSSAVAQALGTVTEINPFTAATGTEPADGLQIKANDGNYYGTTTSGGTYGYGTVYRYIPAGQITVLHNFRQDSGTGGVTEGSSPKAIIQGADGNLYGICRGGGTSPNTPSGGGTFFRLGLNGTFEKLYDFDNGPEAGAGEFDFTGKFPSGIVQGNDGNFYGVTRDGGAPGNYGTYFRLSADGHTRTVLYTFTSGNGPGTGPEAQLLKGSDGNFYGLTQHGGASGGAGANGSIFVAKTDGSVTPIHIFAGEYSPSSFLYALIQGSDGALYGTGKAGGTGSGSMGAVFRCTLDGTFSLLHVFQDAEVDGIEPLGSLTQGSDGFFYGVTNRGFAADPADLRLGPGSYYQVSSNGTFTTLAKLTQNTGAPQNPYGNLTEVSPRNFVGVTASGSGDDSSLINLAVSGQTNTHHPFFTSEVALSEGVYYLAFPANSHIFGYYKYLSDPHFIYHFDLGFEYVFDASDSSGSIYFYDFASSDFFYTSPTFGFPYLYDFGLQAFLYYYPDPTNPQRYNTNGVRYFYNFSTGQVISK